jgi:hypothetical protein
LDSIKPWTTFEALMNETLSKLDKTKRIYTPVIVPGLRSDPYLPAQADEREV